MPHDIAPLVSFLVPIYNGKTFVVDTLQSALDQTYRHIEVMVIDDGSTDGSLEHIRSKIQDDRLTVLSKAHLGIAGTRNFGLRRLSPDSQFCLFLDQDDVLEPDMLSKLVATLQHHSDAVGAYAIADYIDTAGAPYEHGYFASQMRDRKTLVHGKWRRLEPTADVHFDELFIRNHVYPPSCVLLRTALVLAAGGCDQSYEVADDWDLMVRLSRKGPLIPVNDILVGYRRHGGNASGDLKRNIRETRMVWANTYFSSLNTRAQQKRLRLVWRAYQRERATQKIRESMKLARQGALALGLAHGADALAHLLLITPLPWWRSASSEVDVPNNSTLVRSQGSE